MMRRIFLLVLAAGMLALPAAAIAGITPPPTPPDDTTAPTPQPTPPTLTPPTSGQLPTGPIADNDRAAQVARLVLRLRAGRLIFQIRQFRAQNIDVVGCRRAGNMPGRPFLCLAALDLVLAQQGGPYQGPDQGGPYQRQQDDPGSDDPTTGPSYHQPRQVFQRRFNCVVLLRLAAVQPAVSVITRDCVRVRPTTTPTPRY